MTMSGLLKTSTITTALLLAATGCNSHKNAATHAPTAASSARPGTSASHAASPNASTGSSAGAGAAGSKSCPTGATSAVIGGKSKCLVVGQLCSAKHLTDYPQYGFMCTLNGTRYTLTKKH